MPALPVVIAANAAAIANVLVRSAVVILGYSLNSLAVNAIAVVDHVLIAVLAVFAVILYLNRHCD